MKGQQDQDPTEIVKMFPLLCLTFIALIVLMVIFVRPSIDRDQSETMLEPLSLIGLAFIAAGAGYAQFKLTPKKVGSDVSELLSPGRFQIEMLISLALIEMGALHGIFFIRGDTMSIAMPVASIAVIALGVLPHALHYVKITKQ